MKRMIFALMVSLLVTAAFSLRLAAQNPAASRGEQLLSVNQEECMRRARAALQAEGYTFLTSGTYSSIFGGKSIHTAGILCNPAPEGRMWVNIVVASVSNNENVPGAERVRLQGRMESAPTQPGVQVVQASWSTHAVQYRGQNVRVAFDCPRGGTAGNIWGTDYYTDDSSICTAAVHSGLITFANGGRVTIEMRQGAQSYTGSNRYGVSTGSYGNWYGSFVFVR